MPFFEVYLVQSGISDRSGSFLLEKINNFYYFTSGAQGAIVPKFC